MASTPNLRNLRQLGWLAHTPSDFQMAVLKHGSLRTFARNEYLFRLKDPPGGLWGVVEGSVEVQAPDFSDTPLFAHVAWPGDWVGETGIVRNEYRNVSVITRTKAVLIYLSLSECRHLLAVTPGYWQWLAVLSDIQRRISFLRAREMLLKEPRQRVAAALLRLAGASFWERTLPNSSVVLLSQENMAAAVGMSRAAINSAFKEFEADNLIAVRYRKVEIRDPRRLYAVVLGRNVIDAQLAEHLLAPAVTSLDITISGMKPR